MGSTYLLIKTSGPVQERAYHQAIRAAWAVLGFMVIVSMWTPIHDPSIPARWLSPPRIYFVWTFPLLGMVSFWGLMRSLNARREMSPFSYSILLFLSAYLGLITAIYPYAIPPSVTLQEAAAQRESLLFIFWGVLIVLPVVLGYTVYSYSVFRGKVDVKKAYE